MDLLLHLVECLNVDNLPVVSLLAGKTKGQLGAAIPFDIVHALAFILLVLVGSLDEVGREEILNFC